jgi:hypothetical protein
MDTAGVINARDMLCFQILLPSFFFSCFCLALRRSALIPTLIPFFELALRLTWLYLAFTLPTTYD